MPTTAQPAAGTALPSGSLQTGLIFARNEAETNRQTLANGSETSSSLAGNDPTWSTDGDGRYKTGGGTQLETWSGAPAFGPEFTIMCIVKGVSSASIQALLDSDDGSSRNWQFRVETNGTVTFIGFLAAGGVGVNFSTANTVSTSAPVCALVRVKNYSGTYKAEISLGGTTTAEQTYPSAPRSFASGNGFALINRLSAGGEPFTSKLYFSCIWNRALTDAEVTALTANPWSIYDSAGSPGTANGVTVSAAASLITGSASGVRSPTQAGATNTATASLIAGSASGVINGTLTIPVVNNTDTPQTSITIPHVVVHKLTDRVEKYNAASVPVDGSGNMTLVNSNFTPGQDYIATGWNADGSQAFVVKVTAT